MLLPEDETLRDLLSRLDLERVADGPHAGDDFFVGTSPPAGNGRIYGGLVFAQSMRAAQATVATDRMAHSAHAYFLRPGDPEQPITYAVDRIRDGGTFTTRRVVAHRATARSSIFRRRSRFGEAPPASSTPRSRTSPAARPTRHRSAPALGGTITREQLGSLPVAILVEDGLDMTAESGGDRGPELRAWFKAVGPLRRAGAPSGNPRVCVRPTSSWQPSTRCPGESWIRTPNPRASTTPSGSTMLSGSTNGSTPSTTAPSSRALALSAACSSTPETAGSSRRRSRRV